MIHSVQLVTDNYDIQHNPNVRLKYPSLYREVMEHDSKLTSSWYDLSETAYNEYLEYFFDIGIGYIS